MKNSKFKSFGMLFLIVFLSFSTSIFAQRGNRWSQNSGYERLFNPETMESLDGTVVKVERIFFNKYNSSPGIHLMVRSGKETVSVHLGPSWYLDNQDIQFSKGDLITVSGSKIIYKNKPAIIATEVVRNDYVLNLRDANGFPVWSGWRRSSMVKGKPY